MCDHGDPSFGENRAVHDRGRRLFLSRWFVANSAIAGALALLWLVLRSGTKPSRLAYPCQQAALTSAGLALCAPLAAAIAAARAGLASSMKNPARAVAAVIGALGLVFVWGHVDRADATLSQRLQPPNDHRARVFHVTGCPQQPDGDRFTGLDRLLQLMGRNGLKFYESERNTMLSAPGGIIGSADVIVIKINYQWMARGGTNVDLLSGLIRAIVDHPDGFSGEIVVAENAQFASIANFNRNPSNAEDQTRSPHRVVEEFRNLGYAVSHFNWTLVRHRRVDEYADGDDEDGYLMLDSTAYGTVTYPKFQTEYGTAISIKEGIWDPVRETYDRGRLKFINLPVLKSHGRVYGATACVKNYMGLVTDSLTNSHGAVRWGLMGEVMVEIGLADLNILDCIWINGNPYNGPDTPNHQATRLDQLVASTDPIAADIWAVRNILIPTFEANGHSPPWPNPSADPDDPDGEFRTYLDNSMEALLEAGIRVTNNPQAIDVFTTDASVEQPTLRRPARRVRPVG